MELEREAAVRNGITSGDVRADQAGSGSGRHVDEGVGGESGRDLTDTEASMPIHGKDEVASSSLTVGSHFLPQRHRSSIPFLSTVVLSCPQGEGDESSAQESKMTLYLAIGRPSGPRMVRRRSPVRSRASASIVPRLPPSLVDLEDVLSLGGLLGSRRKGARRARPLLCPLAPQERASTDPHVLLRTMLGRLLGQTVRSIFARATALSWLLLRPGLRAFPRQRRRRSHGAARSSM